VARRGGGSEEKSSPEAELFTRTLPLSNLPLRGRCLNGKKITVSQVKKTLNIVLFVKIKRFATFRISLRPILIFINMP
jgi:hypothetical protein